MIDETAIRNKITELRQEECILQQQAQQIQANLYGTQGAIQVLEKMLDDAPQEEVGQES